MENKGLRINMDKTKVLVCRAKPVPSRLQVATGRMVYVVKGFGEAKFFALSVGKWIHKRM